MMDVGDSSSGSSTRRTSIQRSLRDATPQTVQSVDAIISPLHSAVFPRKSPGDTSRHTIVIKKVKIKTGQRKDVTLTGHTTTERLSPFPSEIQKEGEPKQKRREVRPQKRIQRAHPVGSKNLKKEPIPSPVASREQRRRLNLLHPPRRLCHLSFLGGQISSFAPFFTNSDAFGKLLVTESAELCE